MASCIAGGDTAGGAGLLLPYTPTISSTPSGELELVRIFKIKIPDIRILALMQNSGNNQFLIRHLIEDHMRLNYMAAQWKVEVGP